MTAAAFYDLTYAELALTIEGYTERMKQSKRDLAWVVSYLLQPHLKEGATITPAQLLGEKEPRGRKRKADEPEWMTPDDAARELAKMQPAEPQAIEVKNG
jgi:hypothetical protein